MVVGRQKPVLTLRELLTQDKSSFVAVTGRRRVGKTFLIDQVYQDHLCLRVTGIQDGDMATQIGNFTQRLAEYSGIPIVQIPDTWQQVMTLLRVYLDRLPTDKKHVIFLDELPWMSTARSGVIQLLAHLWNDYLSKHKHFILVICGSATSWIQKKIVQDRGGFHNRLTRHIRLAPFTLAETATFLASRKIRMRPESILELYMILGGIPYYLEQLRRGESLVQAIDRLCFSLDGPLRHEYDNLYRALFDNATNHEAIVRALASKKSPMTRAEILKQSKVTAGGPYTRAMEDLLASGFVEEQLPFGRRKRGTTYRLIDEYSVFYHRYLRQAGRTDTGQWQLLSSSQAYRIWAGYAFEGLCLKHISGMKRLLGIREVYTETSTHRKNEDDGYQIDLLIDRKDDTINLCECKHYSSAYKMTSTHAEGLVRRRDRFIADTGTRKTVLTTLITNGPIQNKDAVADYVDVCVDALELLKA